MTKLMRLTLIVIAAVALAAFSACGGDDTLNQASIEDEVASFAEADEATCDASSLESGDVVECTADGSEYRATITDSGDVEVEQAAVINPVGDLGY